MRTPFHSLPIAVLAAVAAGCRANDAAHATWSDPPGAPPVALVTWTGAKSLHGAPAFHSFASQQEFDAVWTDEFLDRLSGVTYPQGLHPRVDFGHCVGFAWAAGPTWNTSGYEVRAIERVGAEWHVRLTPITYQSHGAGDRVTPYAIVLLTRVPGATIVVDEDVRDLIDAPPQWKERGRLAVPTLAAGDVLAPVAPPETARFAPQVLAALRGYERFPRVSDLPGWSPLTCRAPPAPGALASASDDGATHGSKLYFLFARDAAAYDARAIDALAGPERGHAPSEPLDPAPIGQVLVKQAWQPEPVDMAAPTAGGVRSVPDDVRASDGVGLRADVAVRGGRLWRCGRQLELFVLMKLDPATPDTDSGWVYATVTPDLQQVTAAGRIESCMRCHERAEHDRQFGLPRDWLGMRDAPR